MDSKSKEKCEQSSSPMGDHMVMVDGVNFPKVFETNRPMHEQIDCIKRLELRHDDVIICAFPKCGTHWFWEMVSMLTCGKADYEKRSKETAMLEAARIEDTQALPSPRILNTHVPVHQLPVQIKEKKIKVVHVYRNVKDTVVSLRFHAIQGPGYPTEEKKAAAQEQLVKVLTSFDETTRNGYFPYLKAMDKFIKDNPDIPVFNVAYEEAKEDHVGVVKRLNDFLGLLRPAELCEEIAMATSLSKMREANDSKLQLPHLPKMNLYRKGEVGDWKNHLTVAQSERLDSVLPFLEPCNFRFRYTL